MRRRLWTSLIGIILVVTIALIGNIATGNTPILGLDLQGGVSVILAPTGDASSEDLEVIRDLIRDELERRGIAEPDVRVQGETIVVDLPGVRDQQDALDAVNVSGVVELRPVLNLSDCSPAPAIGDTGAVDGVSAPDSVPAGIRRTAPDPEPAAPDSTPNDSAPTDTGPDDSAPTDTGPVDTGPADVPVDEAPDPATPATPGAELLPTRDGGALCVGPAQGTGEVFARGSAQLTAESGWGVSVDLRSDGQAVWNALANQCYNTLPACPPRSAPPAPAPSRAPDRAARRHPRRARNSAWP
jgi:preprotein translocase subunit SecD